MARILESQGEKLDLVVLLCASVSSALRFKLLQRIVNCLGVVERLGTEQKLDRFLAYRERLIRVKEIQNYYRERLADISGMTPGNRIDLIRERASVALPNLARAFASVRKNGERQSPKSETDATGPIVEDRRKRANAAYARAIQGYVPGRFCGPVTLLWPSELTLEDPNDPTAGWSRVASDVDVHMVPGGHITCVTNHVTDLARALSTCLEKAHAGA
jgi:thioesterase domain-containing protein